MPLATLRRLFYRQVWEVDADRLPRLRRALVQALRVLYLSLRDLGAGQLSLQAMGLVYTTLLSMVPLLAFSFSVLKAFGVHNQIEPVLLNLLAPLGDQGREIVTRVIAFVDNMKAGVLGSVGLVVLVYTVMSLVQKVESALNYAWSVPRPRSLARRFSDYLSVILVGPVLFFGAMGAGAAILASGWFQELSRTWALGGLLEILGRLLPYLMIAAGLAFLYLFVPNTRVRWHSALVGALVAAALWQATGWFFTSFVVASGRYTAIYSAFAALFLFVLWLYLSWLIVLLGGVIAYYHQHPESRVLHRRDARLSHRLRERLATRLTLRVARSFAAAGPPPTLDVLVRETGIADPPLRRVVDDLVAGGILLWSGQGEPGLVPARALDCISLADVLGAIRRAGESPWFGLEHVPPDTALDPIEQKLEGMVEDYLAAFSIHDLVLGGGCPAPGSEPPAGRGGVDAAAVPPGDHGG